MASEGLESTATHPKGLPVKQSAKKRAARPAVLFDGRADGRAASVEAEGSRMQVRGEGIGRMGGTGRRGCSEPGIRLAPMGGG